MTAPGTATVNLYAGAGLNNYAANGYLAGTVTIVWNGTDYSVTLSPASAGLCLYWTKGQVAVAAASK